MVQRFSGQELTSLDGVPSKEVIWREHFRLSDEPFALTPDPAFLFLSDSHAEALAGLKLGILEGRGLMVLTGEVGTGKTTIVYSLLSGLDRRITTAYLSNTSLSFEETLQASLKDFGVCPEGTSRLELLESLNEFLGGCAEQGKTAALVIDEAQNRTDRMFEELRLVLNFETYRAKLLQGVLVGQPELGDRLRNHRLRQLADRVAVRCTLRPLSTRDTRQYIDHRLRAAGGSSAFFTRSALSLLVRRSRGIPRRVNILGHNSMIFAFGEGKTTVRRALVAEAARDTGHGILARMRRRPFLALGP
jgi:type II secretory pathway predicted ATPase ExeA